MNITDLGLTAAVDALQPHVLAVALVSARLVPVAFLCPLFGGSNAPTHVKLGLVLTLAFFLHAAGGISSPPASSAFDLAGLVCREVVLGLSLGLVAALPFDIARMGGRFIDLFRGSSAEAALPFSGSRESATGDALYQLLLGFCAVGVVGPTLFQALFRSYALVPLGTFHQTEAAAEQAIRLVGAAFSSGLAIGAPVAALSLALDACVGLASRAAPNLNMKETGTPLRILVGGVAVWLSVGVLAERLQTLAVEHADALGRF